MQRLAFLAMLLTPATALAADQPGATPPGDKGIRIALQPGETIEARADGDLNDDGLPDIAYVVRGEDRRTLRVRFAGRNETAGPAVLDPAPLEPAEMLVDNGVLVVKDLAGGPTATAMTYRFRGEKGQSDIRLIGIDATSYSRSFTHDGRALSWNLLTGDVVTTTLKLVGSGDNAAYDRRDIKRFRRPIQTIWMQDVPPAVDVFDAGAAR